MDSAKLLKMKKKQQKHLQHVEKSSMKNDKRKGMKRLKRKPRNYKPFNAHIFPLILIPRNFTEPDDYESEIWETLYFASYKIWKKK